MHYIDFQKTFFAAFALVDFEIDNPSALDARLKSGASYNLLRWTYTCRILFFSLWTLPKKKRIKQIPSSKPTIVFPNRILKQDLKLIGCGHCSVNSFLPGSCNLQIKFCQARWCWQGHQWIELQQQKGLNLIHVWPVLDVQLT